MSNEEVTTVNNGQDVPGGKKEKPKFSWSRLLITLGIVVFTAAIIGGGVWYVMDRETKKSEEAKEEEIKVTESTPAKTTTKSTDETSSWKTYSDHASRFTLKYPTAWSYKEDVVLGSDGSLNSNVFSDDNVIFYDSAKNIVIGYNMGEILGRGGACTKRMVTYTPTVTTKKLTIVKKEDTTTAVSADEYCGVGETLTGYQATIENFTQAGVDYFIHSEGAGATDAVSTQAIDTFEKMAATLTFS
jgi:hypothetical protein